MNKGLKRGINVVAAMATAAVLASCSNAITSGSRIEQGPVGIGRGVNELKGTPCACTEIPMVIPEYMSV